MRPPSSREDVRATPPPLIDHAAQAASKISAGSRASKYIGMTASQLKQRNSMPQPATSRLPSQQPQPPQPQPPPPQQQPTSYMTSPTPAVSIGRPGLGSRLSQPGSKTSLMSQPSKIGAQTRTIPSTSATSAAFTATSTTSTTSATSAMSATTTSPLMGPLSSSRPRMSPTPGRLMSSPARRLSSRASDHSDTNSISSITNITNTSSSNLLDQATLIQMAESPKGDLALRLQQLELDFGVAIAENNMLKTEMNQTRTQLEMARLLEKRDLSYEERVFLSKSLGRGGIDERLSQELEDMHAMKAEWEKERATKDQEIKAITEKMTQTRLDTVNSQKEKTVLLQEKTELEQKLKDLKEEEESKKDDSATVTEPANNEEQQALIGSLRKVIETTEEKITILESKIRDLMNRAIETEEVMATTQAHQVEQAAHLADLELQRDDLQVRLDDVELVMKVTTEALQAKLEVALRDVTHSDEQLQEVQARLNHEFELRRQKESEAEAKMKTMETELQESQTLLAKSERQTKMFEEKIKDYESSIDKREQEISSLKCELEDLAGMTQSEDVNRMRKVWENERKRLEEAITEDMGVISGLRADIEALEEYEAECRARIGELEAAVETLTKSNFELESEITRLKDLSAEAQEKFEQERSEWQVKVTESENALESQAAESKQKIENLEAIAQSVESWKGQCEAMQLEMVQKSTKAEDSGLEVAEVQSQRDAFKLEAETAQKELLDMLTQLKDAERIKLELETAQSEKSQLLAMVSELESALALSAATSVKATAAPDTNASEPNSKHLELEEEIAHLKQMVHDLTRENVTVANENKKLMQEHDNLMEAHKHVETECLKLMDEVERLHSESLAAASTEGGLTKDDADLMENAEPKTSTPESQAPTQSQSVIRLEGLLKEKQALLDRLTQAHATEMRDLRQRYVDLDRSKASEVSQLNKELTDLESLIESKIFREADLEEEVHRKQKQIDRLELDISSKKGHSNGSAYQSP
ncbi:hypothetical protein BGZ65_007782, partial [Modicella reniformis]